MKLTPVERFIKSLFEFIITAAIIVFCIYAVGQYANQGL